MAFEEEKRLLVERQIKARGIRDEKVLAAMLKVERHLFVPDSFRHEAYGDYPLPIGHGQTISQPYIVALMTEALQLKGHEKVLEVGTGSGYQAAVLAEIARQVVSIERIPTLSARAREVLQQYPNLTLVTGDGSRGYQPEAPYDAIVVTAAASRIPDPLVAQLAHRGTLVIPVGGAAFQELVQATKTSRGLQQKRLLAVRFVPLIEEQ